MTEISPSAPLLTHGNGDIAGRLREFVRDREAFSSNAWNQLLSVMRICSRWATENGRSFLPMSPDDLRNYLLHLQAIGRASSTIGTHAALISMLHRNAGLIPPTTSPVIFRAVKKINRTAVISGERAPHRGSAETGLPLVRFAIAYADPRSGISAYSLRNVTAYPRAKPSACPRRYAFGRRPDHS